jgi:hypothetical protein
MLWKEVGVAYLEEIEKTRLIDATDEIRTGADQTQTTAVNAKATSLGSVHDTREAQLRFSDA